MTNDKEKLIEKLDEITNELQDLPNEESILSVPKVIRRLVDRLGEVISTLENDVESFKMNEKESE